MVEWKKRGKVQFYIGNHPILTFPQTHTSHRERWVLWLGPLNQDALSVAPERKWLHSLRSLLINPNYSKHSNAAGMPGNCMDPLSVPHTWPFRYWEGCLGATHRRLCVEAEVATLLLCCSWRVLSCLGRALLIMSPDWQSPSVNSQSLWVTCFPRTLGIGMEPAMYAVAIWGIESCSRYGYVELKTN